MGRANGRGARRLLVASVGVATVSFASCQRRGEPRFETFTSGNLLPVPALEAGVAGQAPDAGAHEEPGQSPDGQRGTDQPRGQRDATPEGS